MAKTMQDIDRTMIWEMHCKKCNVMLGYILELPEVTDTEIGECSILCLQCGFKKDK